MTRGSMPASSRSAKGWQDFAQTALELFPQIGRYKAQDRCRTARLEIRLDFLDYRLGSLGGVEQVVERAPAKEHGTGRQAETEFSAHGMWHGGAPWR